MDDIKRIALHSVRTYFAPLVGAYKGIFAELARLERERAEWYVTGRGGGAAETDSTTGPKRE